jgi:hypothetical protein
MPVVISWIKTYTSANDGEVLSGQDLGDIQTAIDNHDHTTSLTTFISLADTPATYAGQNNRFVRVNNAETALEFTAVTPTSSYIYTFTNADLVAGLLTVSHLLGVKIVLVSVFNNNDKMVIPDDVTLVNTNTCTVDLTSYGTITGSWNIKVIA